MEIKLIGLTKEFESRKKGETIVTAVDHIDVNIPSGKLVCLLGPSGCGKSTTLYMISGLHKPTDGKIIFGDKDVTNTPPEKRGIGLVFQNYALYPHMTVLENIMFPLLSRGESKKVAAKKALEMAKLVGIDEYMDRRPGQMSGGQQQRVAIARAIVKTPDVLLLDEPLSNLDARLRITTREEIRRIQKETGITTVFVTHDQEEAMSISDEIIVMSLGKVQQVGAPQDVYNEPKNQFVAEFLGTPPINIIKATYTEEETDELEEPENPRSAHIINKKLMFGDQEFVDDITPTFGERMILTKDTRIGIRPEFFEITPDGKYEMKVVHVEFIGRDKNVIFTLPGIDKIFKCIVPQNADIKEGEVTRFNLKRYFIFDMIGRRVR